MIGLFPPWPHPSGHYVFAVEAQDSAHMNTIGARGDLNLAITTDSEIISALVPSNQVVGVWSFTCLRRYWCGDGVFGFEAGKRSPRGEGTYTFVSAEGEDIYSTLKQFIEKAKQAAMEGKRAEEEVKKVTTDVNIRPKFPLPPIASRTDPLLLAPGDPNITAEGEGRESELEDESKCYDVIPSQPAEAFIGGPPLSPFKHGAGNTNSLHHTDISGPSPAYMKRANTSKPRRMQQWLKKSVRPKKEKTEASAVGPSLEMRSKSPDLEEDTYSHTQHVFQRRATECSMVDDSLYNALVHTPGRTSSSSLTGHERASTLKAKKKPPNQGQGEEEGGIYSIAYPSLPVAEKGALVQNPEYGTLGRSAADPMAARGRTLSSLPLAPAKTSSTKAEETDAGISPPPVPSRPFIPPPPPESNPLSSPSDIEDGMVDNLVYDSKENLLQSILHIPSTSTTAEFERAMSDPPPNVVGEREGVEGRCHSSVGVEGHQGNVGGETSAGGVAEEEKEGRKDGEEGRKDEEEGKEGIQRDAKGYSKVDKNKKQKQRDKEGGGGEEAPPLPPRNYMEEESPPASESEQNVGNVSKDGPPADANTNGISVSEV